MPLPGALSIYPGEEVLLRYIASAAPTSVLALARVEHTTDWEKYTLTDYLVETSTFTADRTPQVVGMGAPGSGGVGGCIVTGGGIFIREATPALKRGQFYARFFVLRAGLEECLCCGYLYSGHPFIAIGSHTEPGPGGGEGWIHTVTGTDPAANAEASEAVPTNAVWKLLSYSIVLVADANVADRTPRVLIDDGATTNRRFYAADDGTNPVQAGETRTCLWLLGPGETSGAPMQEVSDGAAVLRVGRNLDPHAVSDLIEGYRIRTVTPSLQAGDNYAAPIFQVEEWLVI